MAVPYIVFALEPTFFGTRGDNDRMFELVLERPLPRSMDNKLVTPRLLGLPRSIDNKLVSTPRPLAIPTALFDSSTPGPLHPL